MLFDLDGTLLDIDLERFFATYFERLGPVVSSVTGGTVESGLAAVLEATRSMMRPHPGVTNADVFWERLCEAEDVEGASPAGFLPAR